MTLCLRAFYYAADRRAFFRRVAGYTRMKFVFDFDPRTYDRAEVERDLRASGFAELVLRRSSCRSSRRARPRARGAARLEHTGPLARAALRVRGIWFVAASPSRGRNLKPTCAPRSRGSLALAWNVGEM